MVSGLFDFRHQTVTMDTVITSSSVNIDTVAIASPTISDSEAVVAFKLAAVASDRRVSIEPVEMKLWDNLFSSNYYISISS